VTSAEPGEPGAGGGSDEERWRAVVLATRAEFWDAGQDPNDELYTLFPARLLRGRLTEPAPSRGWFTWRVPDDELARRDARDIARDFYARYREACARVG
jgi:hypothetical protein